MTMPGEQSRLRYGVVSFQSRRDLEDPMRFFREVEVLHFCRSTPDDDHTSTDFRPATLGFGTPVDLWRKLHRARPDLVQTVEPFALITVPYTLAIAAFAAATRTPLVAISPENIPVTGKYGPVVGRTLLGLLRPVIRRAALAIYLNEGARRNFLHAGARPDRLARHMYGCWGVDLEEFSPEGPRVQLRRRPDEQVILFVGRLEASKGVFDLLEAFRQLRRATARPLRLVFVGRGSAADGLRRKLHGQGLDGEVELLGPVKNREVAAVMRGADLLATPSVATRQWAEQVGNVLLQAMACGLPVVATRSGSIPEFVTDGVEGLLVPECDPAALRDALSRVVSDAALRERLVAGGRAAATGRYDAVKNVRSVEAALLAARRACA